MSASWSVTPLYENETYIHKDEKITLGTDGKGQVRLPEGTLRRPYTLDVQVREGKQMLLQKRLNFAVMSDFETGKVDIEKEWLGIDTVELRAQDKKFAVTVKVIKLLGLHWVRKKHVWAQQYESLEIGAEDGRAQGNRWRAGEGKHQDHR